MEEKGTGIDWSAEFAQLANSLGDIGDQKGRQMALDAAGVMLTEQLYIAIRHRSEEGNSFFKGREASGHLDVDMTSILNAQEEEIE